jgi:nicotinate-nucleotide adenylyltransferase
MTGLFGGAFDPPHNGHLALARAAIDHFSLQRLVISVAGEPPLKVSAPEADVETRIRLAEAAFGGIPQADVSRLDVDRPQPAYSHETVRLASERWGEVIFLIGADRFADFPRWKAPDEVLRCARLGVATRPGVLRGDLDAVLARLERPDRVEFFEIPPVNVSSSDVRRRAASGESIDGLVPPAVAELIRELGLYRR